MLALKSRGAVFWLTRNAFMYPSRIMSATWLHGVIYKFLQHFYCDYLIMVVAYLLCNIAECEPAMMMVFFLFSALFIFGVVYYDICSMVLVQ